MVIIRIMGALVMCLRIASCACGMFASVPLIEKELEGAPRDIINGGARRLDEGMTNRVHPSKRCAHLNPYLCTA